MSRSNPRQSTGNPIKKYVTFSGGTGTCSYYDKEKAEKVELDSLDFIILDVRSSITGFDSDESASYSSNMVKDISKESIKVSQFKNKQSKVIFEGSYADFKEMKVKGAKFTSNVLALVDFGNGNEITDILLSGSALNNWIELQSKNPNNALYDFKITLSQGALSKRLEGETVPVTEKEEKDLDAKLKKNPRAPRPVWFYQAKFDLTPLTEEEIAEATESDKELQKYLGTTAPSEKPINEPESPFSEEQEGDDDMPF